MFEHNMGPADRAIRLIAGLALFGFAILGLPGGALTLVGYVIGGVLLLTALAARCPLYRVFRLSTCGST